MKPLTIEERNSIREYLVGLVEDWATGHEDYADKRTSLTIIGDFDEEDNKNEKDNVSVLAHGDYEMLTRSIVSAMVDNEFVAITIMALVAVYQELNRKRLLGQLTSINQN
jgi:hypothetical protein